MFIIVPINIEALRVSQSTSEKAKRALYDFSAVGNSPLSVGLIAAYNAKDSAIPMYNEPGIHLHWSIPRAYTQGTQNKESSVMHFPCLPNRWIITRFFQGATTGNPVTTDVTSWVLESDKHASTNDSTNSLTPIPWMNNTSDLTGMDHHYAGERVLIDASDGSGAPWSEPGGGDRYLGKHFQAPFGYGETFTAYYRNCQNVFGIHDDLSDVLKGKFMLPKANFSVSYLVTGWVSDQQADVCVKTLKTANEKYAKSTDHTDGDYASYIQQVFEQQLKWTGDFSSFTPDTTAKVQPVMSGIITAIDWDGTKKYPTDMPDAGGITTAIGNSMPEAVSAYLNFLEPGNLPDNMEWLLNAMQTGRLPYLANGETGVGQLEEYLHSKTFGSRNGGSVWMTRGAEPTLPPALAGLLGCLNDCQQAYDRLSDELSSRQQKCFFDWNYHMQAVQSNIIQGHGQHQMGDDNSKDYLLDGMMQLFPLLIRAGATGSTTQQDGPYIYAPASLQWQLPATARDPYPSFPGLSGYTFNKAVNEGASAAATVLLQHYCGLSAIPDDLDRLIDLLQNALLVLDSGSSKSPLSPDQISQAITSLQDAQDLAQAITDQMTGLTDTTTGLPAIASQVKAAIGMLANLNGPAPDFFFNHLPVTSSQTPPLAASDTYMGSLGKTGKLNIPWWQKHNDFSGMQDGVDQCTGQGQYKPNLFDLETAGLYLAIAYFWQRSRETPDKVVPYYIQMAQQEVIQAQSAAQTTDTALQNMLGIWTATGPITDFSAEMLALATQDIPAMLTGLGGQNPDTGPVAENLRQLLTSGSAGTKPVPEWRDVVQGTDWQTTMDNITTASAAILQRLPLAHQIALYGSLISGQTAATCRLSHQPAAPFWEPGEPVLLLAENDSSGGLLRPVNRNGTAALLPCRLDTQLMEDTSSPSLPDTITGLAARLNPNIDGLSILLQGLAEEAFCLTPEFNPDHQKDLQQIANALPQGQSVRLPSWLEGVLPYYIAYNWWPGTDSFLPLYINWTVNYLYSQRFDFTNRVLPPDALTDYTPDEAGIDYQPTKNNGSFKDNSNMANSFSLSGIIPLSSAATANLCNQIIQYCKNNLGGYDPSGSNPPGTSDPDGDEKLEMYRAYHDFRDRQLLSQSLSGINTGMLQRMQELQLPVNVPASWMGPYAQMGDFWPSQFLLQQSAGWPQIWKSEAFSVASIAADNQALHFPPISTNQTPTVFNPLRAGFLQLSELTVIDVFGRFQVLANAGPQAIAHSMNTDAVNVEGYPVYLPPRLVQPSRLSCKWMPAAGSSPVCGWLLPNHLDDSLMVYNSDGQPLGSVRHAGDQLLWLTVPGASYTAGGDNNVLMTSTLSRNNADPHFTSFLENFIYPPNDPNVTSNFQNFLSVVESAGQFVITKSMQEDPALGVLIGQPLVMVRATLKWDLKGLADVSLDKNTFIPWDAFGSQFRLDGNGYKPYNFDNFNDAGVRNLQIPINIGAVNYLKDQQQIVFFDDGLVGYFINDDYTHFYTPVDTSSQYRIATTCRPAGQPAGQPLMLTPGGPEFTVTLIMDPRASVHVSSCLLPVNEMLLPQDQYLQTLNKLLVTFLTAPVLEADGRLQMPLPSEAGYGWSWWQVGALADLPLRPGQSNSDALFYAGQQLIDGWLKLKKA